jgi:hypothetical protein
LIFKGFGALLLEADSFSRPPFLLLWIISSAIVFHSLQSYIALAIWHIVHRNSDKKRKFLAMASVIFVLFRKKKTIGIMSIVFVMLKSHLF